MAVAVIAFLFVSVAVADAAPRRSSGATAWTSQCLARARTDRVERKAAELYCQCTASFMVASGRQKYVAWKKTHSAEAAFCEEKAGVTAGPGRGY